MCTFWIRSLAVVAACLSYHATLARTLKFSSYWGTGEANNRTVAVDHAGSIYMSGGTSQPGWPTTFGPAHAGHGESDVTIAKFAPDGKLIWARLLGGPSEDYAYVSAVGPKGELYVSGRAGTGFPTTPSAFDRTFNGGIGGTTHGSAMTPTPNAFQKTRGSPPPSGEAYVAKLSPDGKRLAYFAWLGGVGNDEIETEGVSDGAGNFYVAGSTASSDFPTTANAFQRQLNGGGEGSWDGDGWVAKINNDGRLAFSTLYGGTTVGNEGFFGPVVGPQGDVYCTGRFRSKDCPLSPNAFQPAKAGAPGTQDAMLVVFSPDGRRLLYGSYFGGLGSDHGRHIGIHPDGRFVCIIGETSSKDLPLHGAVQSWPSGTFLAKFAITNDSQSP